MSVPAQALIICKFSAIIVQNYLVSMIRYIAQYHRYQIISHFEPYWQWIYKLWMAVREPTQDYRLREPTLVDPTYLGRRYIPPSPALVLSPSLGLHTRVCWTLGLCSRSISFLCKQTGTRTWCRSPLLCTLLTEANYNYLFNYYN